MLVFSYGLHSPNSVHWLAYPLNDVVEPGLVLSTYSAIFLGYASENTFNQRLIATFRTTPGLFAGPMRFFLVCSDVYYLPDKFICRVLCISDLQ